MKADLDPWNLPLSPPGHSLCSLYLSNPQPGNQKYFLQPMLTLQTLEPLLIRPLLQQGVTAGSHLPGTQLRGWGGSQFSVQL